jgi:hypothetical protein
LFARLFTDNARAAHNPEGVEGQDVVVGKLLTLWRGWWAGGVDAHYGHATDGERRTLSGMRGQFLRDPGGYSDAAEHAMDEYFDAAEGRPRDD